jgi:hypothetical protein
MLYRTPQPSVKEAFTLTGRQLSSSKWTKSQRAAFAAMVLSGELELTDITQAQLCRLFQVSRGYLNRALALPAKPRTEMAQGGLAIAEVPPEPTEKKLAEMVRAAGVERTWEEICRQVRKTSRQHEGGAGEAGSTTETQ